MKETARLFGAVMAGAAGMYLLDPVRGRRRRVMVRDKLTRAARGLADASEVTARDFTNRARGTAARLRSLGAGRPVNDQQIAERIRSTLGFVVRHPRAVEVRVEEGCVRLTGPILADEVDRLLAAVAAVRGVKSIDNHLRVHSEPGNVPDLQGEPPQRRRGRAFPLMQRVWSPTTRLFAGTAGGALMLWALGRGGLGGLAAGLGGLALLLRSATNLEFKRIVGIGAGRQAVTLQKTINIGAPVEQVFEVWSRYENFPRFMVHVREVRRGADGRSHWVVSGPGGLSIEWDTEESAFVPNRVIGWRTVPGSTVEHFGIVRFDPNEDGGTRVHIRTSWNPPAGALGYGLAALLGSDPKRALDDDLIRFKSLIEGESRGHGRLIAERG